jgi:hypothetical protein
MTARQTCRAITAFAPAGIPQNTHRTLLTRNTQKPIFRRPAFFEPTSQAARTDAANAGHWMRSTQLLMCCTPAVVQVLQGFPPTGGRIMGSGPRRYWWRRSAFTICDKTAAGSVSCAKERASLVRFSSRPARSAIFTTRRIKAVISRSVSRFICRSK